MENMESTKMQHVYTSLKRIDGLFTMHGSMDALFIGYVFFALAIAWQTLTQLDMGQIYVYASRNLVIIDPGVGLSLIQRKSYPKKVRNWGQMHPPQKKFWI